MEREEILAGIHEVARTRLGWEGELAPEMNLVEDLGLDSLKSLTLTLEIENHFRVYLDQEREMLTVGDVITAIRRQLDG